MSYRVRGNEQEQSCQISLILNSGCCSSWAQPKDRAILVRKKMKQQLYSTKY